jgi:hypothetical protein
LKKVKKKENKMDKFIYTILGLLLLTSCGALLTTMSSPAAFEAEELVLQEVQHEINPTAAPAPEVSKK